MKKYLYLALAVLFFSTLRGQSISTDKNAIIHSQFRTATTTEADGSDPTKAKITVQYLDGLGRNLQTLGYKQSPLGNDIVSGAVNYDAFGRITQQFSTTPMSVATGNYQNNGNVLTAAQALYGDNKPYTLVKTFDNSPLNRVLEQYGVGEAWQNNTKFTKTDFNIAGTDVLLYRADASKNINKVGTFLANSIYKTTYTDEQGHQSIEYKDRAGKLIQKQVQDDSGFMTTYYVYDLMDRLVAILQPKAYELGTNITVNTTDWNEGVFFNIYNAHGQITQQKVPSADWAYFVYDNWDRLVLSQTGLQRQLQTWNFYKYDALNREIIRGELSDGGTLAAAQAYVYANATTRFETLTNTSPTYYTNNTYPTFVGANEMRQITYYDTYATWLPSGMSFDASNAFGQSQYTNVQGLQVGSRSKNTETSTWLANVSYFDNKGRVIQTFINNLYGQVERADFQYNFAGEVVQMLNLMKDTNGNPTTKVDAYTYDNVGRKTAFNSATQTGTTAPTPQETCTYAYDEIGRPKTQKYYPSQTFTIGGVKDNIIRPTPDGTVTQNNTQDIARKYILLQPTTDIKAINLNTYTATVNPNAAQGTTIQGLQTIDFAFHIRGGLRGINLAGSGTSATPTPNASQGDLFSYKLDYETAGFYDGNIGKQTWQNANAQNAPVGLRTYTYGYDAASRLKTANYTGINGENYSLSILNYDKNGNIGGIPNTPSLQRYGKDASSFVLIDNLTYNYNGNRLQGVKDAATNSEDVGDFKDDANHSTNDYTYWSDGSLKSDGNKGIDTIKYDSYLKKVSRVHFSNGKFINFFYDGNGTLLKRTNSLGDLWEYTPNGIYKNGTLYQFNQSEGRILLVAGVFIYEFEYRDHLGNLRVAFNGRNNQLNISQIQETDPFGLEIRGLTQSGSNLFKFQKQENITDFGLNLNWFKYRPFDPQTGRSWQIDRLAEKYSNMTPYQFDSNNPILNIEIDGLEGVSSNSTNTLKKEEPSFLKKAAISFFATGIEVMSNIGSFFSGQPNNSEQAIINNMTVTADVAMIVQGHTEMVESASAKPSTSTIKEEASIGKASVSAEKISEAAPSSFIRTETISGNQSSRTVGAYLGKIQNGEKIEPIKVREINGEKYVIDGHHRLEASTMANTNVPYKPVNDATLRSYQYQNNSQVMQAAADATATRPKIDYKLVRKTANQ